MKQLNQAVLDAGDAWAENILMATDEARSDLTLALLDAINQRRIALAVKGGK